MVEFELRHFAGQVVSTVNILISQIRDVNANELHNLNEESRILNGNRSAVKIPACAVACICFNSTE
jgi:hypothetical protein